MCDAGNAHGELEEAEQPREEHLLVLQPVKLIDESTRHGLEHSHLKKTITSINKKKASLIGLSLKFKLD